MNANAVIVGGVKDMEEYLKLREDTSKGYVEAYEGDGVQLGYTAPTALLRAVVGHQRANTLTCNSQMGVVVRENEMPKVLGGIGEKDSNNGTQWKQQNRIYDNNVAMSVCSAFNPYYPDSKLRIRKLTPRECWRLQGFPDEYFDKAVAAGVSNSQLYKQAGNGVSVNISEVIGRRLKEIEDMEND